MHATAMVSILRTPDETAYDTAEDSAQTDDP